MNTKEILISTKNFTIVWKSASHADFVLFKKSVPVSSHIKHYSELTVINLLQLNV